MAETYPDAYERILRAEQKWNADRLNLLRPVGALLFLLVQTAIYDTTRGTYALMVYCVLALALFFGARRSDRISNWSTRAVPALDMPAVFLKQSLDIAAATNPRALATFSLGLFILLILLSGFTLRSRQVYFAGTVTVILELLLQMKAGDSAVGMAGSVVALGLATAVCETNLSGRIKLARRLSRERLRLEKLSRYFSPQVAAAIESSEDALAAGRTCEITVLFGDLRGFTAATENAAPGAVVDLLNTFHASMVEAIFAHEGTLDKYIGDGLMAYFGAPVAQPDHPARAFRCALAMLAAVQDLNTARAANGQPPLRLSIGLHTGPAVVGAIGCATRREFTAVGDTVNVAARIENLTREYGCDLLLSGATASRLGESFEIEKVASRRLRGRSEDVAIFFPRSGDTAQIFRPVIPHAGEAKELETVPKRTPAGQS